MTITGVDVSHHQGIIDWRRVAAVHRFAFIKATEGLSFRDGHYATNITNASKAGLLVGAYHFARPVAGNLQNAREQARYHARIVGSLQGRLPSVLDIESGEGDQTSWALTFLEELETLTGRRPIVYTFGHHWRDHIRPDVAFARYPLWIARYNGSLTGPGTVPRPWSAWTFWQRTSTATTPGVNGNVDLNHFAGTEHDLLALAGSAPPAAPPLEDLMALFKNTGAARTWFVQNAYRVLLSKPGKPRDPTLEEIARWSKEFDKGMDAADVWHAIANSDEAKRGQ